jgi:hypothetical protein
VLAAGREVLVEGRARAGFDRLERLPIDGAVGVDVDPVDLVSRPGAARPLRGASRPALEEDPVVRVEAFQPVVVLRAPAETAEEALEDVGHEIPGRPHVEPEPVLREPAGATAELLVFLQEGDVVAGVGQVAGRREAAEAAADHDHRRGRRLHARVHWRYYSPADQ